MNTLIPAPQSEIDFIARRKEILAEEWALHKDLLDIAREAVTHYRGAAQEIKGPDLIRLIDLAARLGRASCGMQPGQSFDPLSPARRLTIIQALDRIYGPPIEVTVEEVKPPASPTPDAQTPTTPDP